MSFIRLSFAFLSLIAAAAVSPLPSAMSRQPGQICSYANINTRFAHPLCAYRNRVTRLKQFAFALWKRARAWLRCRVTRTSLAPMPMVSARCTPHFRSNNSRKVRKSFGAPAVLPGRGASISVAPSIHPIPRKRSVSATYCEPKNGLRWAANATLVPVRQGIGPAQRSKTSTKRLLLWSRHLALITLPLNGAQRPTDETDSLRDPRLTTLGWAALFESGFSVEP